MALDQEYFDSINITLVKQKYYNAKKVHAVFDDIRAQALALGEENAKMKAQLQALVDKRSQIGDKLLAAQDMAKQIIEDSRAKAEAIRKEAESAAQAAEGAAREAGAEAQRVLSDARNEAENISREARAEAERVIAGARFEADKLAAQAHSEAESITRAAGEKAAEALRSDQSAVAAESQRQLDHAVSCVDQCITRLRQQQLDSIEAINAQWQDFLCELMPSPAPRASAPRSAATIKTVTVVRPSAAVASGGAIEERLSAIAKELKEIGD